MSGLSGGDKFIMRMREIGKSLSGGTTVTVGFISGATYSSGIPVALVAAVQEFGAPSRNIPPRPFFRGMIRQKSRDWPEQAAKFLKANGNNSRQALEDLGALIAAQLELAIVQYADGPPLAPATVKRKGFSKQLIDTGMMKNSVTHVVD